MVREETVSRADRDEDARAATAKRLAKSSRSAELERRDTMKQGQKEAEKGSLPQLVKSGE